MGHKKCLNRFCVNLIGYSNAAANAKNVDANDTIIVYRLGFCHRLGHATRSTNIGNS